MGLFNFIECAVYDAKSKVAEIQLNRNCNTVKKYQKSMELHVKMLIRL